MKASRLTYLMVIALALTVGATGCKRKPTRVTDLPGRGAGPIQSVPPGSGLRDGAGIDSTSNNDLPVEFSILENFNQDRAPLAAHTVQFAYDSVAIRSSEQSKVDAVASFIKSAPGNVGLLIEGHCDERGTEEYNRALGERRALALREALMASGASGSRIITRSYGKDRKVDTGSSEAAHSRNRRGEFVVLTPK
jgi:peptidoglycan-associated lipoprotein